MRLSVISVFAATVLAIPFVSAQTVQTAAAQPQPVSAQAAATGASATTGASAATRTASSGTRRDIVSYVEELAGNTAAQLRAVQDENAALETRMIELERKMATLQDSNQKLLSELASVKSQAAADAAAHEKQMQAILTKIDKLAVTMTAAPTTVPTPVSTAADYDIYEVQKGATLSVIAKAYTEAFGKTVTVQDIKKANNLKSDTLQIGQKLKIPRK